MANILEKIVADKRVELEQLKAKLPLESFIDSLVPTTKDLYQSLSEPNAGFILECKKASPSKGLIRPDFDVVSIAKTYENYAAGISVLTDEKYFQGTFDYLKAVTDVVSCPVLNKDFFVDSYQVYLARYYGADAILLMLSVLTDEEYLELAEVAQKYNLTILTEISNEEEQQRAIKLGAKLIGINNRNLRDLSTDISRTFDLAPGIPDDRLIISESGIYTNNQVRELAPAVDGFLVGSSLMAPDNNKYQDIDLACRKLIYGENKVCGLTSADNAAKAIKAGARFGGLIFAEKSPRFVNLTDAKTIVSAEPPLDYVGVFVNQAIEDVITAIDELGLYAVQLHGQEDDNYVAGLKAQLTKPCQIWQALPVTDNLPELPSGVDHIVLDNKQGGSGQAFNWQLLTDTVQPLDKCLLAGGLALENIEQAISLQTEQELYGLDLNSGVESSPGDKCEAKLAQVFSHLRNY